MRKRKQGFTLIELLAVIVILAIIALIATPIILNIIKDTKESACKASKELYLKTVEQTIAKQNLTESFNPTECTVDKDGNLDCDGVKLNIEMDGEKPSEGTITIEDGIIKSSTLKYNGKDCPDDINNTDKEEEPNTPTVPTPVSFAEDSWDTIVECAKEGNCPYELGETKEVDLGELGTHTLRIANTTTPEECNTEGFSQTACGFVLEFADIITEYNMNSSSTNTGGWRDSKMRTYVNDTIYNSLPTELKKSIINTYVVSGHGNGETQNNTSTDKLYLFSTKEIWGTAADYDTVGDETRQLDYYKSIGVTTSGYSGAIKRYNGGNTVWWLRSAGSNRTDTFYFVQSTGGLGGYIQAIAIRGVAPAFRLG